MRLQTSAASPPEDLPGECPHVDRDISHQSQPPPLTSHPRARKTALPLPHRAIPTRSVQFRIVSVSIAAPLIHAGVMRGSAAHRNASRTLPRSRAFHLTTVNRDPMPSATVPAALLQFYPDLRIFAFRRRWLLMRALFQRGVRPDAT